MVNYFTFADREVVEQQFRVLYDAPFQITGEDARGYKKRVVAEVNVPSDNADTNSFMAFRVTIYADQDN